MLVVGLKLVGTRTLGGSGMGMGMGMGRLSIRGPIDYMARWRGGYGRVIRVGMRFDFELFVTC